MKISGKIVSLEEGKVFNGEICFSNGKMESVVPRETAEDCFIMPGLIDAHVHVESSMVIPSHFAVTAVKHGTVAVVADPHEIANVLGLEGVRFMIKNASSVPVRFLFGAPSCVPATNFESSGASLSAEEIEVLFKENLVSYLAEMMNFPGVIYGDKTVMEKLGIAHKYRARIDGHAPGLTGKNLEKYVYAGISTDHECSTIDEAREKLSLGMKILIREGSAAKNLKALAPLIKSNPDDVMLCTDDTHPETFEKGHINKIVARLVNEGYDLLDVLKAATINPAKHYGIDIGMLRPGDKADFIVVDNPRTMNIISAWINGECVFDGKRTLFSPGEIEKVNNFKCSRVSENEIRVKREGDKIRVIVAYNGEIFTGSEIITTEDGLHILPQPEKDILKIVVKERYNDAPPAVAFIKGFGLKRGAFATSVAHDSHNVIAVGASDREIVQALNMVIDAGGGMSVVAEHENHTLKLPVAGLMSDMPVSAIAGRYERLTEMVKSLGCRLDAPYMTLSFMALLVIPELKLSDRGLFDTAKFSLVPLFAD